MRALFFGFLVGLSWVSQGQDSLSNGDTTFLSLKQVLKMTVAFHPVVRQANLFQDEADAKLRSARGTLDPKLALDYDLKNFKETEYFDLLSTSLKVPTRLGIDPKIAFNRHQGEFVDRSDRIPVENDFEQVSIGFDLPIGKGLFYDERRNAIDNAKAFAQIATAEQIKEINKILLTVVKDYWDWYVTYRQLQLLNQAIALSQNLFDRTLIDFEFGEAAVVDTLQAKISLQKRTVDYRVAQADYALARLNLAKHLWSEALVPLEIAETVLPDSVSLFVTPRESELDAAIAFAMDNHPEINKLEGKRSMLAADLRWARESLKPQVDFSYSFIDAPISPNFESETIDFGENYKLGLDFSFPILLRKERGKLQQTKLKIQRNEFDLAQSQLVIRNDVIARFTQSEAFEDLLAQYLGVSQNWARLLNAELINLQNGEADLFKLNIQQDKYIEAQTDYYDALFKWEKSKAEYYYITGVPYLGLEGVFDIVNNP
ncbi:MAG: TolC family protein [Bacteroidota bacterium]